MVSSIIFIRTILVRVYWYLIVPLILISLKTNAVEYLFMCFFLPFVYLPCRSVYSNPLPILYWAISLLTELYELFHKLDIRALSDMIYKHFLTVCSFYFHCLNGVFWNAKVFTFYDIYHFYAKPGRCSICFCMKAIQFKLLHLDLWFILS